MTLRECVDADAAVALAAELIAVAACDAVAARGQFLVALSGGRTPGPLLPILAQRPLPWQATWVFQVDERVAPDGHADRNLNQIHAALVATATLPPSHLIPMPVAEPDLAAAARTYASRLSTRAGTPPVLDLVVLGLGADGHTASLFPGDDPGTEREGDVAVSREYHGRRRLTLTSAMLSRSRGIIWLVTGESKHQALQQLLAADPAVPAGRVEAGRAVVVADRAALVRPQRVRPPVRRSRGSM